MKRYLRTSLWMALLTLILVIGVLAVPASAAEVDSGTCGENLTWVLDDTGTLTISGTGEMYSWYSWKDSPWDDDIYQVVIEDGVTSIGSYAFDNSDMVAVTIPNSVTYIESDAFVDCYYLCRVYYSGTQEQWDTISIDSNDYLLDAELHLNGSRPDIGSGTYGDHLTWLLDGNGTLTISGTGAMWDFDYEETPWYAHKRDVLRVVIENGATTIGPMAFHNCYNLIGVTIPDSVTTIGDSAFYDCNNLTGVTIPDSVTTICDSAFYDCYNLTGVTIPESVTDIGAYAFYNCDSLTGVTIPDSVIRIGDGVFWSCSGLKNVSIGRGLVAIPSDAFKNCDSLTSVIIPDSVTTIGDSAFYYCGNLTGVTIPDSVIRIGDKVFTYCSGLTNVSIGRGLVAIPSDAFYDCDSLTSVIIPDNVAIIGAGSFCECDNLTSVTMGSGVISIRYYAFANCPSLTDVTLGSNLETIDSWVFSDCENLTEITIPDSVTTIGESAFSSCSSLAKVNLGNCTAEISWTAFDGCEALTAILVNQSNTAYSNDSTGVLFNKDKTTLVWVPTGFTGSYTIPNSVTAIGDSAFYDCDNLTGVTIPNSVTTIRQSAFYNCDSLTGVTIPDSVTTIGDYAFRICSNLTTVKVGSGITRIPSRAFEGCYKLSQIIIPDSVEYIFINAFGSCDNLIKVCYGGTREEWKGISVSSGNDDLIGTVIHYNENKDHLCDTCGYVVGGCRDLNNDHNCDRCGDQMSECIDENNNHRCDICDVTLTTCADGNKDHNCDTCGKPLTTCADGNNDHKCDTCEAEMGKHEDTNKDHSCEYGCDGIIGKCVDENKDHKCDYGCSASFGVCEDTDKDGKCDYGCDKKFETESTEPDDEPTNTPVVEGTTRLAGENRLVTSELIADQLKEKMGVEKFQNIIVASGGTFADALPGSYLAAVKNAPILLTLAKQKYIDQTAAYIKANLAEGGTVYILGGESAVPSSMETALTGMNVKRVAGADRFGTNLAILKEAGVKRGSEILVCTAKEFADSLSAAATGKPILLVYKKITDEQKAYLGTLSGNAFCVVGGSTAVPDNIIAEICNYGSVSRLAGKDRLDTSILVAQKYFPNATSSVVAYGWDFPDGLCGGSLAYATKSPLILTHSKEKLFKFTADYTVEAGLNAGYVLGGDGLVSDAAAKAIFNCNEITILK